MTVGSQAQTLKHVIGDFQPDRLGNLPTPTRTPIESQLDRARTATLERRDWLAGRNPVFLVLLADTDLRSSPLTYSLRQEVTTS